MVIQGWSSFIQSFSRKWRQGEHITIIGPTGSGKSFLALQVMRARKYYILLLTKGNDSTLDKFVKDEKVTVIQSWPLDGFEDENGHLKVALWPRFTGVDSFQHQHNVFSQAINGYKRGARKVPGIYTEGGWSVLIDEVMYFTQELKLEPELRMLWTQGRSNNISLVAGTQRPRDVPMLMLNQYTHLFVFQSTDKYEIERLASIGGNVSNIIKEYVPKLQRHQFLYINRITAEAIISKASV